MQKPDKYEIQADIPGVREEDINISVDGDALTISVDSEATKSDVKEEEGVRVHRQERAVTFVRYGTAGHPAAGSPMTNCFTKVRQHRH